MNKTVHILTGDVLAMLATLPDESVHCCCTSPPYWGLRDYGVSGQIGLEPTPEAFIAKMVAVFAEVRRVLREDGTMWLNIGDSYTSTAQGTTNAPQFKGSREHADQWAQMRPVTGLKPKDLCMMPWRVALALQADGWYLRSVIVWAKKSPMPESVRDRPTSSWEPIFLMSKSERYFYDAEAVKEPWSEAGRERQAYGNKNKWGHIIDANGHTDSREHTDAKSYGPADMTRGRNLRNVWHLGPEPFNGWTYDFSAADYVDGRGIPRKWSPDCPKHERDGRLRQENPVEASCDAQAADPSLNSGRTCGNHEEAQPFEPLPTGGCSTQRLTDTPSGDDQESTSSSRTTCESGSEEPGTSIRNCGTPEEPSPSMTDLTYPPCSSAATPRSSENRRKAHVPLTSSRDTDAAETSCGRLHTQPQPMCDARGQHKCESSTSMAALDLSEQTPSNTTGISVSSTNGKCLCRESKVDHFATFPTEIPRRAILAGTSEKGCCPECGAGWVRQTERTNMVIAPSGRDGRIAGNGMRSTSGAMVDPPTSKTIGWSAGCECNAGEPIPCTVLDPFLGSGTTIAVARQLGRHGVGIELNPEYVKLAEDRIGKAERPHTYASKREEESPLWSQVTK